MEKLSDTLRSTFFLFDSYFISSLQLIIVAYDDGEPVKVNKTLVVITVLQPSVIPVFTQEEYRYTSS